MVATPAGEIVWFNPAAERLFGYAAAEVIGRNIAVLVPPEPGRRADAVRWLARWAAEPQAEQSRFLEFNARRKDGRPMPVDVRVAEGQVAGEPRFFITVRDNTARREALAALKEENLRTARMLLLAEDAIVSCGADQRIRFFNLAATRMFGYLAEQVMGQPLEMLLPEASRAIHPALMAAFGAGSTPSRMMSERREVAGRRRNGQIFPVEAAITRVTVGGVLTYAAHLRDISERKAAQARLVESERRFRAMFDHAAAAIALLAPDGTVLEINRAAAALTEGAEALLGRPLWELPWLGATGAAQEVEGRARLRQAVAAAGAGQTVRYVAELGEGEALRRLDLTLTPIRGADGAVAYILPEGHMLSADE